MRKPDPLRVTQLMNAAAPLTIEANMAPAAGGWCTIRSMIRSKPPQSVRRDKQAQSRAGTVDFGRLFDQHGHLVYRRALRILGSDADAQEAVQEVFVRAMRGFDQFNQTSKITTWLYQITTHYCLNQIRDRKRRNALLLEHHQPPEPTPGNTPQLILLRQLLAEADPQQAQAAVYVLLEGMSQIQAAPLLGVAPRTVGNLVDRFTKWARKRVEK